MPQQSLFQSPEIPNQLPGLQGGLFDRNPF